MARKGHEHLLLLALDHDTFILVRFALLLRLAASRLTDVGGAVNGPVGAHKVIHQVACQRGRLLPRLLMLLSGGVGLHSSNVLGEVLISKAPIKCIIQRRDGLLEVLARFMHSLPCSLSST